MLLISIFSKSVKGFKSALTIIGKSARHFVVFTRAGENKLKLVFNIVVTLLIASSWGTNLKMLDVTKRLAFAYRKQRVSVIQC